MTLGGGGRWGTLQFLQHLGFSHNSSLSWAIFLLSSSVPDPLICSPHYNNKALINAKVLFADSCKVTFLLLSTSQHRISFQKKQTSIDLLTHSTLSCDAQIFPLGLHLQARKANLQPSKRFLFSSLTAPNLQHPPPPVFSPVFICLRAKKQNTSLTQLKAFAYFPPYHSSKKME